MAESATTSCCDRSADESPPSSDGSCDGPPLEIAIIETVLVLVLVLVLGLGLDRANVELVTVCLA